MALNEAQIGLADRFLNDISVYQCYAILIY